MAGSHLLQRMHFEKEMGLLKLCYRLALLHWESVSLPSQLLFPLHLCHAGVKGFHFPHSVHYYPYVGYFFFCFFRVAFHQKLTGPRCMNLVDLSPSRFWFFIRFKLCICSLLVAVIDLILSLHSSATLVMWRHFSRVGSVSLKKCFLTAGIACSANDSVFSVSKVLGMVALIIL